MVNRGIAPLDPTTDIGKFRLAYGDIQYVELSPPEVGYGDYEELSDDEIRQFLAQGGSSVNRALGYYYLRLSGQAAKQSKSIKDYDLQVDTTKRAADLRALAQWYFDQADTDDLNSDEAFEIVPMGKTGGFIPEGTIPVWGREYTWGRWR